MNVTAVKFRAAALGSNLFGALVGGVLESLSFWFGLKFLLLLAACLYAAAGFAQGQRRTLAEQARTGIR